MAYIGLKQLDPTLTGSLQVSGSSGVTGSLDVDTNIVAGNRVTSDYGTINYTLVVNEAGHGGGDLRVESANNAYQIFSDANQDKVGIGTNSLTSLLTVDGDVAATHVTASGNISGSSTSTGSFGYLNVAGNSNFIGDLTLGGNITIGDATSDSVTIAADFTSNLIPNANVTYDLGSTSKKWRDGFMASLVVSSSASGSTAITSNNITNGYPTSNAWG